MYFRTLSSSRHIEPNKTRGARGIARGHFFRYYLSEETLEHRLEPYLAGRPIESPMIRSLLTYLDDIRETGVSRTPDIAQMEARCTVAALKYSNRSRLLHIQGTPEMNLSGVSRSKIKHRRRGGTIIKAQVISRCKLVVR